MILLGYFIAYALIPLSLMTIQSISAATSENQVWPFGYWFVLQMVYSLTIGALPATFLQFGLMKAHLAGRHSKIGLAGLIASNNWLFNSDLASLTKMTDSLIVSRAK